MNCRCCFDFYVLTVLQGSSGDQVSFNTTVGGVGMSFKRTNSSERIGFLIR